MNFNLPVWTLLPQVPEVWSLKPAKCFQTEEHYSDIHNNIVISRASDFLYPATKVWRGIMLYPSVSVRPSVLTISDR